MRPFPLRRRSRTATSLVTTFVATLTTLAACNGDGPTTSDALPRPAAPTIPRTPTTPTTPLTPANTDPVTVQAPNATQAATVGVPFQYDASRGGTVFTDPRKTGLTYSITFTGASLGLSATSATIRGTPTATGIVSATVSARDTTGRSASQTFSVVVFGPELPTPSLPTTSFAYSDAAAPLPRHFTNDPPTAAADNMPATNPTTNAGATLGRVLFYDRRLSVNDRVACASCHQQQFGFADTARLSRGFADGLTGRHSMGLSNARFYQPGRFFWDERAISLEDQVLRPIQDATEMGMTLPLLISKVQATPYYGPLFTAAFGTAEVTSDRIARALSQFVRSMISANAKIDLAFSNGPPNFAVLSPLEQQGQQLFAGRAGCARCHGTNANISDQVHNTGLDATITDVGAGNGRFKAPSLRNIAVRPPYMHDGRFRTLEEVVEFYNSGVQNNPGLDQRLRERNGQPQRLNLSAQEKAALVAFLNTFTDQTFLTNPKFSNPFAR